jgi:triacylglycerol esterase/lipase EstA (alpha/beta hydrolase family)
MRPTRFRIACEGVKRKMSAQRTYPIALAHGIARFDFLRRSIEAGFRRRFGDVFDEILSQLASHGIKVETDRLHYFRGIKSFLEEDGFDPYHTNVSFAESIQNRAALLKSQIEGILSSTGADKVHIIAHSMGGLDSRFMIARMGMADRVASLTTIGTPHLGTSLADVGLREGGEELIQILEQAIDLRGFGDLARDSCAAFNDALRNMEAANDVFYQTYASAQDRPGIFGLLKPSWDIINREEGENDGLVPVTSQKWVPELTADDGRTKTIVQKRFPIPADHLNEVGWWDLDELRGDGPFRRLDQRDDFELAIKHVYLEIARGLRAQSPV